MIVEIAGIKIPEKFKELEDRISTLEAHEEDLKNRIGKIEALIQRKTTW